VDKEKGIFLCEGGANISGVSCIRPVVNAPLNKNNCTRMESELRHGYKKAARSRKCAYMHTFFLRKEANSSIC